MKTKAFFLQLTSVTILIIFFNSCDRKFVNKEPSGYMPDGLATFSGADSFEMISWVQTDTVCICEPEEAICATRVDFEDGEKDFQEIRRYCDFKRDILVQKITEVNSHKFVIGWIENGYHLNFSEDQCSLQYKFIRENLNNYIGPDEALNDEYRLRHPSFDMVAFRGRKVIAVWPSYTPADHRCLVVRPIDIHTLFGEDHYTIEENRFSTCPRVVAMGNNYCIACINDGYNIRAIVMDQNHNKESECQLTSLLFNGVSFNSIEMVYDNAIDQCFVAGMDTYGFLHGFYYDWRANTSESVRITIDTSITSVPEEPFALAMISEGDNVTYAMSMQVLDQDNSDHPTTYVATLTRDSDRNTISRSINRVAPPTGECGESYDSDIYESHGDFILLNSFVPCIEGSERVEDSAINIIRRKLE